MKKVYIVLISVAAYILLSSSVWVRLNLMRPAELQLPDNIKTIAIIDRTQQDPTVQNKLEQTLSGETFKQDEQAKIQVAEGFINTCAGAERFAVVRTGEIYTSDGTKNTFPQPMSSDMVRDICSRNHSDAVLAIEIFDSDFMITNNPINFSSGNENNPLPHVEFHAMGVAVVNFGVRLYDASGAIIMDEFQTSKKMNFEANGSTIQAALNTLIDKVEAVKQAGYEAGVMYAQRITPTYYTATRYFFDRPKKSLGKGVRQSEVADWQGAIDSWLKVVEAGKKKAAGRAAYNIAVGYEVLGNLDKAKEWAAKSHTDFENKEADDYYKVLSNRAVNERIVNQQLQGN